MATDLELKVKVDSSQLDQVEQKVGKLQQLSKSIAIQYDIDGKPLDVVIDKSLNLRKQVGELTKALRSVKEGSDEFRVLSTALGDANDKLAASNAKSRDLLGSLQLIPGPIGQIASQLNGAISALKLFSGFSIKDIGFQFKELFNDITDISNALFGFNKEVEATTDAKKSDTEATNENTQATDEGTVATNAGTAANQKQTAVIQEKTKAETTSLTVTEKKLKAQKATNEALLAELQYLDNEKNAYAATNRVMEVSGASYEQARGAFKAMQIDKRKAYEEGILQEQQLERAVLTEKNLMQAQDRAKQVLANLTKEQQKALAAKLDGLKGTERQIAFDKFLTEAQNQNTKSLNTNTGAKEVNTKATFAYTAGTQAATFATNALNIALKALGIGLVIGAVIGLFELFKKLGTQLVQTTKEFFYGKEVLQEYKDAALKSNEAMGEAQNKILEVGVAFEEAAKGTITKKKALEIYNQVLGSTIGEAKTLEEAEKLYKDNTEAYIKSVGLRAEAQELFALAAKQSALQSQLEIQGYFEWFFDFDRKFGETAVNKFIRTSGELLSKAQDFRNRAKDLLAESLDLQSGFKPKDDKTGETKKPEVKPLQDEELLKRAKDLGAALIQDKKKTELEVLEIAKDREKKEIEALNISDKNKAVRAAALIALENKYQIERKAIIEKYQKEEEDKAAAFAKKLSDISTATITNDLERDKQERENKFNDDKIALEKDLEFIKLSEETKNHYRLQLKEAYDNDIEKLENDAAIKSLENQKAIDESRLKIFQMNMDQSNAMRLGYVQQYFQQQLKVEEDNYQIELKRNKDNKEALLRVETEHAANVAAIKEAERRQKSEIYQQGLDDLANVFAEESDLQKAAIILKQTLLGIELGLEISKTIAFSKLSLARSKVAVAEGTAQTAKIGFPQNVIPLALYAIQAALIIATIVKAAKAIGPSGGAEAVPTAGKNYGDGGIIEGPSHSSAAGGTIINAEGGEAVMTKGAVTMFRPLLSLMNQAGGGTAFGGGVVGQGPYDNPATADKSMEPQIIKTYIVERDLTSIQERQARLKSLSTL